MFAHRPLLAVSVHDLDRKDGFVAREDQVAAATGRETADRQPARQATPGPTTRLTESGESATEGHASALRVDGLEFYDPVTTPEVMNRTPGHEAACIFLHPG